MYVSEHFNHVFLSVSYQWVASTLKIYNCTECGKVADTDKGLCVRYQRLKLQNETELNSFHRLLENIWIVVLLDTCTATQ